MMLTGESPIIGFGYLSKDYICFAGDNETNTLTFVIPLIDIKQV
jgi:hypothetical protein